jgi:hypothetical protein
VVEVRRGPTTPSADKAPAVRPQVDEQIDAVLARYSVTQHRWFWHAEAPQLGGATPYEALRAGERDAVLALARGGRSEGDPPLLSRERGAAILEQNAGLAPPYEL